MALVEQPLTSSSIVDLTYGTARPLSPEVDLTGRAIPSLFQGVDLTGGTTPPHSTSPLFKPLKKYIKPDDDFDIDLVNIKLKLDGKIEIHTIRKDQKFLEIFKTVADTHNISTNDVLIYNDSKRIHYDDTPYSIDYRASIFFSEYNK